MNSNIAIRIKRLIYRSTHRGCKETDYIFSDFAKNELATLGSSELEAYEKLLEVDDTTLYSWFNGASGVSDAYNTSIIQRIKSYNESRFKNL